MKNIIKAIISATLLGTVAMADDNKADVIYDMVHNNSFRKEGDSARDQFRHPEALLRFSGITSTSTILEINPGGGWYSRILAPLVKDKGQFIALAGNPKRYSGNYAKNLAVYDAKITSNPELYGSNAIASWHETSPSPIANNSVDIAFAIRTMHSFVRQGYLDPGLKDIHAALKVGGHFIIVQHRANENFDGNAEKTAEFGRWKQSELVAKVESHGFKLVANDEMNANPKDPQDVSVWMLPPTLSAADKNDGKYKNTGETDRMTLKFVKIGSQ